MVLRTARIGALAAAVAIAGCQAIAAEMPQPGAEDSRVLFVTYNPHQVIRVVGGIRSSTQIVFADDEVVTNVAIGNAIAWEVAPSGNVLFLKAREQHPPTNMQVVTRLGDGSRRNYQIELGALKGEAEARTSPMLLVKFRYPTDDVVLARKQAAAADDRERQAEVDRRLQGHEKKAWQNWAYTVQGGEDFEPVAVFDNGKTTTMTFAGNIEMPAIYLVTTNERGDESEELVGKSVNGRNVIVHAIGRKFVLRRGDFVVCVFNERYDAHGVDHGTKTLAADVVRTTKQPSPAARPRSASGGSSSPVVLSSPAAGANFGGGTGQGPVMREFPARNGGLSAGGPVPPR